LTVPVYYFKKVFAAVGNVMVSHFCKCNVFLWKSSYAESCSYYRRDCCCCCCFSL